MDRAGRSAPARFADQGLASVDGGRIMHAMIRALAFLPLAGCAASAPPAAERARAACFYAAQVTSFAPLGPDRVIANVARRAAWELTLSPGCGSDVDWALNIAIVPRGATRICSGVDAELVIPRASGSGAQRCLIRGIRPLTRGEAESLRNAPRL